MSIEPDVFVKSYKEIELALRGIFGPILQMELKPVDQKKLVPSHKFSDKELFNIVMSYSTKKGKFPLAKVIQKNEYGIHREIIKRYDSMRAFAEKFKKSVVQAPAGFWTDERIIERTVQAIKEFDGLPGREQMKTFKKGPYQGLWSAFEDNKGRQYYHVLSVAELFKKTGTIPEKEIDYLKEPRIRGDFPREAELDDLIKHAVKRQKKIQSGEDKLIPWSELSEQELINIVMRYSKEESKLPPVKFIQKK